MSPIELQRTLREQPFEPFRLWLSDGTAHEVRHPETLIIGVRTSYLVVPDRENPSLADHMIKLDNPHITNVEPLGTPR